MPSCAQHKLSSQGSSCGYRRFGMHAAVVLEGGNDNGNDMIGQRARFIGHGWLSGFYAHVRPVLLP